MRPKPMKPAVRGAGVKAEAGPPGAEGSVVIAESWGPQKAKGDQTKLGHYNK